MIILADDKKYAMEMCKDSLSVHFVDTEAAGNWGFAAMRLISDMGDVVFVSGAKAERYLDKHQIYYLHVESEEGEDYIGWFRRLPTAVAGEKELLDANDSTYKLIYGIAKDGMQKATAYTDNAIDVRLERETGTYFASIDGELSAEGQIDVISKAIEGLEARFGEVRYGTEPNDFYEDINLSSGKSVQEIVAKLKMRRAILRDSLGK